MEWMTSRTGFSTVSYLANRQQERPIRDRAVCYPDREVSFRQVVFQDLPAGTYTVFVWRDGYGPRVLPDVKVVEGRERVLDVALPRAATLRLRLIDSQGERVRGRVHLSFRDPVTRKATGGFVDPDAAGELIYRQVVPGTYEARVDAQQHGTATKQVVIRAGENEVELTLEAD